MSFLQLHILVLCESVRVLFPRTVHHMFLLQARLLGIKPCGDHMSLWNAVKDVSHPLWQQQIELKSEDQIPVQRQPGCYPDRGTPCVCRVPFQPLICLRTITCLELPVKNTVGSGSQKHRQAQQSWLFLPAQIKSSFVAIWRVLTTTNETELHTSIQACDLSLRWYNAAFFLSVQVQTSTHFPKKLLRQSAITVWYFRSVHHSQISWEKKNSSPLPVHLQSQRKWSSKLTHRNTLTHRLQTFTHTTHTCCPWAPGRGWGVHGLLRQQFLRWVIL